MVQNRGAPMDRSRAPSPLVLGSKSPAAVVTRAPATLRSPVHSAQRATVSVADQAVRDIDRLAILQQELSKEVSLLHRASHSLATPELKSKLAAEEVQRLAYLSGLHEQNIKALTAEIKRVRN